MINVLDSARAFLVRSRPAYSLLAVTMAWLPLCALQAAELSASEQKLLDDAKSYLKQGESNLKLAESSAGRGNSRPTGSKAKLAMTRLNSAKQALPQINARLEKLPDDPPEVQAFRQQVDQFVASINALEARITGEAPSADKPADQGVKLDYRQEEELKNARFTLREVQGRADALAKLVEKAKAIEDKTSLDHRIIAQGIATIEDARRRVGFVREHLDALPPDGDGVQSTADDLAKAVKSIDESEAFLLPIHQNLSKLVNPASYPAFKTDLDRLLALSSMFANAQILTLDREQAADVIREASAASSEHQRVVAKYAILIRQQTPEGKRLDGASRGFTNNYAEFAAAAKLQKEALPGEIASDLNEARDLGRQAVEERKPLFFTGGVEQRIGWAEEKIALLKVLDPQAAKVAEDKLAQTRDELRKAQEALREIIIASNELPPDNYAGGDRDAVTKLAIDTWKKRQSDADVLAVRIPSKEWKRSVMWRSQAGGWYKVDHSKLQVQLVVKHDDKLAEIRPVNIWKDHLSNDNTTAFPFHEEGDELQPSEYLLLEKVK